uniref:Uncharacterized protein n=1 Tax=Arion vulgaris TaxID=1028688 RepID=A0A0B6YDR1_9EUPU
MRSCERKLITGNQDQWKRMKMDWTYMEHFSKERWTADRRKSEEDCEMNEYGLAWDNMSG